MDARTAQEVTRIQTDDFSLPGQQMVSSRIAGISRNPCTNSLLEIADDLHTVLKQFTTITAMPKD